MKKILYAVIFLLILIGSHNYIDINNIAIISNISIEKKDDKYIVTFQEIVPKRENNTIIKDYKYYSSTKSSLKQAFHGIDEDITKEIYLEHLENIIIKDNNLDIIDNLESIMNNDLDNFNVVISTTDPSKALKYGNNYKYINSIIDNDVTLRKIKKARLEQKDIKIPVIKQKDEKLIFYKYITYKGDNNA